VSYVFHILFAVASLLLAELGHARGEPRPVLVVFAALVPYVLGFAAHRSLLAGRFRWGALLERLLSLSPILLQACAIVWLGWLATLARAGLALDTLDQWPGLELLWALAPYLVYQLAAIDARARCLAFPPDTPGRLRPFQLRLFLSALLPFLAFLAGSSLLARTPEWRVRLEEVGLLSAVASLLLIVLFFHGMPFFLRYAWDTAPIERGWARTMLEQVAKAADFRYRELLVWRTGQQMSNAAIVGLHPRTRLVFFSDLLLQQLGPRELAAVFAHEMGHARRAHAIVFAAFALGFFLAANQLIELAGIESALWGSLILLVPLALWYLAFGYLSRRFELEADLESLRVVGDSGALIRALELVTGAHAHERASWRHFSTKERVAFLQAAERDPLVGIHLRGRLARWRKLGFALFAVAALLQLRTLARTWNEDWLVADLRLGNFEAAAARADGPRVEAGIAALARRAVQAPPDQREPGELELAALAAFRRGDLEQAREWLRLAHLRGAVGLGSLIEAVEAGADELHELPEDWREVVRQALGS
jgi:Zn-dependent protease with chaperone function